MEKYKLVFKRSVAKDLRLLPKAEVAAILQRIASLVDNPRPPGGEKLSDRERYRVRQGTYRIRYEIHGRKLVVTVIKAGHRREVYR